MKKSIALSGVAGMAALVIALPVLAQSASPIAGGRMRFERTIPTQACVQAMVDLHDVQLDEADAKAAQRKQHLQEQRTALAEVAAITDEVARDEALRTLREEQHSRKEPEPSAAMTEALQAVRDACGERGMIGPKGQRKMGDMMQRGRGHMFAPGVVQE